MVGSGWQLALAVLGLVGLFAGGAVGLRWWMSAGMPWPDPFPL